MDDGDKSLLEFCEKMPKIELHAHITGSIRDAALKELLAQRKEKDPNFEADKAEEIIEKESSRTIEECFSLFRVIQSLMTDLETVHKITRRVVADFAADGVRYLELRTTPRRIGQPPSSKEAHIRNVLRAISEAEREPGGPLAVRLLLSIDRSYGRQSAIETVQLAKTLAADPDLGRFLVGIDLSGDPRKGSYADFIPALEYAKSLGFRLALHLAEIPNVNEETRNMMSLPPDRIGHGTYLLPSDGGTQEMLDLVLKKEIPVELCLTSNVKCKTVKDYASHHSKFWFTQNHPLIICTDDMGAFSCQLSGELALAAKHFQLQRRDIARHTLRAIDFAFCDEETKNQFRAEMRDWMKRHCLEALQE